MVLKWLALVLGLVAAFNGENAWAVFLFILWFVGDVVDSHQKAQFRREHPEFY